jgi:hypothetical protein
MKKYVAVIMLLTIAGLGFRLFLALHLPNDEPDDGRLYARIAVDVLEHRSYSIETEEPYSPTLIRVPGYPLFIAGVYAVFGRENNRAVRAVQAVLDTITCWLIALLALAWAPGSAPGSAGILACKPRGGSFLTGEASGEGMQAGMPALPGEASCGSRHTGTPALPEKRRRLFIIALGMAVCCPFPAIYTTTILTETCTTLLATMCALSASLAMNAEGRAKSAGWWLLAGISGGLATMFRPDSGLFVAAAGCTLALVGLYRAISRWRDRHADTRDGEPRQILARTFLLGVMLTIGFVMALGPWTIRNARVFGLFQPIAPAQANMPGEFVPNGYIGWLRSWVSDVKYTELLEFPLDQEQIHIEHVPDYAFDSADERERVARLLERYNNPVSAKPDTAPAAPETKPQPPQTDSQQQSAGAEPPAADEDSPEDAAPSDENETDAPDEPPEPNPPVEMTPEVDAGFAELTRERIARSPIRYYVILPLKRAASLWFDTHSQYYPFQGELLPLSALDKDLHQQYWLPLFMSLVLLYTALGVAGVFVMWRDKQSRRWLLLMGLLIIPRLVLLSSMENPEPRYTVEFFAFVIVAGSLATHAGLDRLLSRWKA